MIETVADLRSWIAADLARFPQRPVVTLLRQPQSRWLVRLRITEWCRVPGLRQFLKWRLQAGAVRLGYTVQPGNLGKGIRLPHWGMIVMNSEARVGSNCQIGPGVVLGEARGGSPIIGNDVYIAPNATLLGPIKVGDRALIGAGAVVTKDVPAGETWAGVPARSLS
ncbi:MAG: transferase hexapeptide repeat containing protein [Frankiales bacterium]|nr:transferase hexapeptide repeat containing protein [Frankiales bacterium]